MSRRRSSVFIAAAIAFVAAFFAPAHALAEWYGEYVYYEGLPADYKAADWEGYGFNETIYDSASTANPRSLSAPEITIGSDVYVCVGWQDGFGIGEETGTGDSVAYTADHDVSITWLYKKSARLTIKLDDPQRSLWGWGSRISGRLGDGFDGGHYTSPQNIYELRTHSTSTHIDFDAIYGGENRLAYAWTYVYAPSARSAKLKLGSDDSIVVWLNNANVWSHSIGRGATPDSDSVDVTLNSGWNKLLIKVSQGGGGWGFYCRFTDTSGTAMTDLKISTAGPDHTQEYTTDSNGFIKNWLLLGSYGSNGATDTTTSYFDEANYSPHVGEGDWMVLSAGTYRTAGGIRADGSLWTWGHGGDGQLGDGTQTDSHIPKMIAAGPFIDVSTGWVSSAAIKADGSLWTWGNSNAGQLGNGTLTPGVHPTPAQVGTDLTWRSVSGGLDYFLAIKKDGSLWAWGHNDYGRLGIGSTSWMSAPTRVGTSNDWKYAVAGWRFSAGIKTDGSLWLWGRNEFGQLGDGTTTDRLSPKQIMLGSKWKTVATGYGLTVAIRDDGTLWAWGHNNSHQLGLGDMIDRHTPVQVGSGKDWRSVAAGDNYAMAIKTNGTLWGWGLNQKGQLGDGTVLARYVPTQIGSDHNWITVSIPASYNGTDEPSTMALRGPYSYDVKPFLGPRDKVAGDSYTSTARAIPTDGTDAYYLSSWKDGSGDVAATGTLPMVSLNLTTGSGLTWVNAAGTRHSVTVGFIPGVPDEVQDNPDIFPPKGTTNLAHDSAVLSAPPLVTQAGGAKWECIGWTGSGSVPETGNTCSVTISLSQASAITWLYRQIPADAVTFSFGLNNGPVTKTDASFQLSENTSSGWKSVPLGANEYSKPFSRNTTVKLSVLSLVSKTSGTYYSTGIIVNTSGYSLPITAADSAGRKEFTISLSNIASSPTTSAYTLDVTVVYASASSVFLGSSVSLPSGCMNDMSQIKNRVELTIPGNASDDLNSAFFWTSDHKCIPVRPSSLFKVTCDNNQSLNFFTAWPAVVVDNVVVGAPVNLSSQPTGSAYQFQDVSYSESFDYGQWNLGTSQTFQPLRSGKSLIRFSDQSGNPHFVVVRAVDLVVPQSETHAIGTKISAPAAHNDPEGKNGFVYYPHAHYDGAGANRAYDRDTRTGVIIPVNRNVTDSLDRRMVVIWYTRGASGPAAQIGWPTTPHHYECTWPVNPKTIVIASGLGSLTEGKLLDYQYNGSVYYQDDAALPGFNPNEEHALLSGDVLYALRNDLNTSATSDPYALLKYRAPLTQEWTMAVYHVAAENATYAFQYQTIAGNPITPLVPMDMLPVSGKSALKPGSGGEHWYHRDHKGGHWAKASNGKTGADQSKFIMHWYYPLQKGFYYPASFKDAAGNAVKLGDPVPFLNGGSSHTALPKDVSYLVTWPQTAPVLKIGETLTSARYGLPAIASMATASVVFDEGGAHPLGVLMDPFIERAVDLKTVSSDIKTESRSGKTYFTELPFAIRDRLFHDPAGQRLVFKGESIDMGTGEPLLLPNIMTIREQTRIREVPGSDNNWKDAIDALYAETAMAHVPQFGASLALTTGPTGSAGYVVLAENDDSRLGSAPVALHIIRIEGGPYQGEVKIIKSDNPFDEKLTLRHSGIFSGHPEYFYFSWYYQPDKNGIPPGFPQGADTTGWVLYADGKGVNDITIEGANKMTLSDNWFMVRYYYGDDPKTAALDPVYSSLAEPHNPANITDLKDDLNNWSTWAGAAGGETAQLAEGWIKRVVNDLNPLDARVRDFRNNETNTTVGMISQLGNRYEGDIALNGSPENINNIGLIEAYQTVLDRGESFSIDASLDYGPANKALLNAATRIADFYTLLGNEAYNDAQDPTVAYDSKNGASGSMASSMFSFQNQLDSLLEEELALLHGRDDTTGTVKAAPVYNNLIWNFTNGDGEVAYVQTYNVGDHNSDGFINEADAKIMYPQGHGDAWGHYLTAMTTWYGLLRNPSYTWEPQAEAVMVGSSPVPIDYLDERKFARTAAYKARTGAEIVDLTYRKLYVEDPAGQWQGYKDTGKATIPGYSISGDELVTLASTTTVSRAWGVDEWARRAGQGAYFDWVVANAMLPSEDTLHSGIQKIDRSTVRELAELASAFQAIQFKADQADAGLNPLGLARGVVPFDIDPNFITSAAGLDSQSHFEQIYKRAVTALSNARTVYDYAAQFTAMLRGNEDTLGSFKQTVIDQERDYLNRLIEIYGYPYAGDIGPGKTYPAGYSGPDIFHFNYMNVPELTGLNEANTRTTNIAYTASFNFSDENLDKDLGIQTLSLDVTYPVNSDMPWNFSRPGDWKERRAPGEVQMALADLIKANAAYQRGVLEFSMMLQEIDSAAKVLEARYNIRTEQIKLKDKAEKEGLDGFASLSDLRLIVTGLSALELALNEGADYVGKMGETVAVAFPIVNGVANDVTSITRSVAVGTHHTWAKILKGLAIASNAAGQYYTARQEAEIRVLERQLFIDDARFEVQELVAQLEKAEGAERAKVQELFGLMESIGQAMGRYQQALARGERLLDERETFRKRTAAEIQDYRYQDLGFRIFRNDAIQKYRATFDLAARYAFLAAEAYDYETNLLRSDHASGAGFLTDIVQQRSPGVISGGAPVAGKAGLADPLARLSENFSVYKPQLGFNNPQTETNPFSLRTERFRINAGTGSDDAWRNELQAYRVSDLNSHESFKRYCRPFAAASGIAQPGLVIPFTTSIQSGHNFFGWPLGAGDSTFDPSHFSTKIRGVLVSFDNYGNAGLSSTPRVYLVPAGADVLRSPSGDGFAERWWNVVDQKLPVPFPLSSDELSNADFIPVNDSLSDDFGGIRQFSSLRAYSSLVFDNDPHLPGEFNIDTRLIGRSVWNTQWLLIIPGAYFSSDPAAGLAAFIDKVTDVKLLFETYSYSGN